MKKNDRIYCNRCGKEIVRHMESAHEDFLHVEKKWGYFSGKDGESHSFDLCEACYDKLLAEFVCEAAVTEETELL